MQFVYPLLTWGFLLMLVPLAIHLINLMRQRRVQWAAMEFLLQSYRKHRRWIWLKQLLLLLARMAIVALVVAMVARLVSRGQFGALFGGRTTHHIVLVDDSYSMSDRAGAATALDAASQVVSRIASQAKSSEFQHKMTLVRYSAANRAANASDSDSTVALDFNAEPIGRDFDLLWEEKRRTLSATDLSLSPLAAVRAAREAVRAAAEDENLVYVLSDFRQADWNSAAEVREELRSLAGAGAKVRLVHCVRAPQANLGLEAVEPSGDTRAAGVPLFVNITVRNHANTPAQRVVVKVRTQFFDAAKRSAPAADLPPPESEDLPVVLFDEVPARSTATQRVQVYFPAPGQHVVEATLPEDPVAADNRRAAVIDFPAGEPVLLIDGDAKQRNAYYVSSVFEPGERTNTGIRPETQSPEFLRDAAPGALDGFRAIYLTDVPRFDAKGVELLENYVKSGGGLAIFVGPQSNLASYNQSLFKGGEGLLPAPLEREEDLPADLLENKPDIEAQPHPIFQELLDEQNPALRLVNIDRFVRVSPQWSPKKDSGTEIIASLRNRAPLIIEKRFGEGRVLLVLTTAAPHWNGWGANNPSFIVMLLKMQAHLARPLDNAANLTVGMPVQATMDAQRYRPEVSFLVPSLRGVQNVLIEQTAVSSRDPRVLETTLASSAAAGSESAPGERAGLYEIWLQTLAGAYEVRRLAINVEPREGDLQTLGEAELTTSLAPVRFTFAYYDEDIGAADSAANNFSLPLMGSLIALLLFEQWLAYACGYHAGAKSLA